MSDQSDMEALLRAMHPDRTDGWHRDQLAVPEPWLLALAAHLRTERAAAEAAALERAKAKLRDYAGGFSAGAIVDVISSCISTLERISPASRSALEERDAAHNRRVAELLEANNRDVDRRRKAEAALADMAVLRATLIMAGRAAGSTLDDDVETLWLTPIPSKITFELNRHRAALTKLNEDARKAIDTLAGERDRAHALLARLWREGALSEGQCAKALGIGRVDWRVICDRIAISSDAAPLPVDPLVAENERLRTELAEAIERGQSTLSVAAFDTLKAQRDAWADRYRDLADLTRPRDVLVEASEVGAESPASATASIGPLPPGII